MSNNEKQEYETFESLIKKTIMEINKSLCDTGWSIDADIKAGGIKIINKDGCSYTNAIGLSERELLDILAGMDLVLTFKEGEKKEGKITMKVDMLGEEIKKTVEDINQHLKDTSSSLGVDFSLGAINIMTDFGRVYNLYQTLSREEIFHIVKGMSLVLALKEKEKQS